MRSGVYKITNILSGKFYIGSASNVDMRMRAHLHKLRHGIHPNRHLQNSWGKHGESAFSFRCIVVCSKEDSICYEQACIDGMNACNPKIGYNLRSEASSNRGLPSSAAQKAAVSAMWRDPIRSAPIREASRKVMKNPETVAKVTAARMAFYAAHPEKREERRQRTGAANRLRCTGVPFTPEMKAKARETVARRRGSGIPTRVPTPRKLTVEDVLYIRSSTEPKMVLARKFGINSKTLSWVIAGRTYKWVGTGPVGGTA